MTMRPKSDNFVAFKCPTELREDALDLAQRTNKSESEIWKEAMEFFLAFPLITALGYWELRRLLVEKKVQPCLTSVGKV